MSSQPGLIPPVPEDIAQVALAAFPDGSGSATRSGPRHRCRLRRPQSPAGPARARALAAGLITVLQFREDLSDRRAADAVRARIDRKYLLGLELADPGFDDSVLAKSRSRLIATRTPPNRERRPFLA
jgi:transposase